MRPRLIDRVNFIQPPYSPKKSQLPLRRCVFPRKIRVTRGVGVERGEGRGVRGRQKGGRSGNVATRPKGENEFGSTWRLRDPVLVQWNSAHVGKLGRR